MPDSKQTAASLAEQAYDILETALVTLRLEPGSIVSEATMIDVAGLGRTPVREAMQRLAHQGLVRVLPRRGLEIASIENTAIIQVLEVRGRLERLVVRQAAVNARDAQRSEFSALARNMRASHDDFENFLALGREAERLLDECADNPFCRAAISPLRTHCRRFWYRNRGNARLTETISAQTTLLQLVARRDPSGASKASDNMIATLERLLTG